MAYRKPDTITAEAEASDAIDDAIEEAIALRRGEGKRRETRARVGRWVGRISLLLSLVLCVVFFWLGSKHGSKPFALAGAAMLILAGGIALMRLGGGLSAHAKGEQARETSGVRSYRK